MRMIIFVPFSQASVKISTMQDASAFWSPFCTQTEAVDRLAISAILAAERACKPNSFTIVTSQNKADCDLPIIRLKF